MKVAYQPELEQMAKSLAALGFDMCPLGQEDAADAVLFEASAGNALRARCGKQGAVLLNVRGMNAAEAAQALRRRCKGSILL